MEIETGKSDEQEAPTAIRPEVQGDYSADNLMNTSFNRSDFTDFNNQFSIDKALSLNFNNRLPAETIRLESGLNVFITKQTVPPGANSTFTKASLSVPAGSCYETFQTAGHNHLLEHVMAKRLLDVAKNPIYAFTNREYTGYSTAGGISDVMHFLKAARMIFSPLEVNSKEMEPELKRVSIERLSRETALNEAFENAVLPAGLAAFPICGSQLSTQDVTPADLKLCHHRYYLPQSSNIVITLPDNKMYDENAALISEGTKLILSGIRPVDQKLPFESTLDHLTVYEPPYTLRNSELSTLRLGIRLPGLGSPGTAEAYLVAGLLGLFDEANSGLSKKLIDEGLIYEGRWGTQQYSNCGALYFSCPILNGTEKHIENIFAAELDRVANGEISSEELAEAKQKTSDRLKQIEWFHQAEMLSQTAVVFQQDFLSDTSYIAQRIDQIGQADLRAFIDNFGRIFSVTI